GRSVTGNGPARSPPGPFVSVRRPARSIVRPPLLWMPATTSRPPVAERFASSGPIAKSAADPPPGPIARYMRTPTRFTSVTPPEFGAGEDTSAQITPYRSPAEASFGTLIVTVSKEAAPG